MDYFLWFMGIEKNQILWQINHIKRGENYEEKQNSIDFCRVIIVDLNFCH